MAIKASAGITLSSIRDLESCTRYYLLQSSTLSKPSRPTAKPPGGDWAMAEPAYAAGSTNSLYFCDLNVFSDGSWAYSEVSLSSSYEAAKAAWNKAQGAENAAQAAQDTIDGLSIGGRNIALGSQMMPTLAARSNRYVSKKSNNQPYVTRSDGFVETACTINWDGLAVYANQFIFAVGEELTFSAMLRSDAGFILSLYLMCYDASRTRVFPDDVVIDGAVRTQPFRNLDTDFNTKAGAIVTSRRVYSTFRWSQKLQELVEAGGYVQITLQVNSIGTGGTVYFFAPKLERGNKATDWTPAPEDVDAATAEAQSAADAAQSAADAAQSTASAAQSTADSAQATADTARAEFRRVVRIDDAGLHVGDNQSNGEVLIDSGSVNVVINGVGYSKFAGNYVQFGDYQMRRSADGGLMFKRA